MIMDLFTKTYIDDFWGVYAESFPQNASVQNMHKHLPEQNSRDLQKTFSDKSKAHTEQIFNRDESVIDLLTFEGFKDEVYNDLRGDPKEMNYFWDTMTNLLKCSCVVDACGEDIGDIESISTDFVKDFSGDGQLPQDMTKSVTQMMATQMMSNTGIFPKLMSSFSDPQRAPELMRALTIIMRQPKGPAVDPTLIVGDNTIGN
jgi:hypothetical protein